MGKPEKTDLQTRHVMSTLPVLRAVCFHKSFVSCLLLLSLTLFLAGCKFGSGRLDADSPHEFEYVQVTEPPLPKLITQPREIPAAPADLTKTLFEYRKRYMTITEAIAIALNSNPNVKVSNLQQQATAEAITIADSIFDPTIILGGGWSRTETQITNTTTGPGPGILGTVTDAFGPPQGVSDQINFSKQTRTGGSFSTNFGTTYTFTEPDGAFLTENPAVRSTLSFQASQPLFQGSGRDINAIGIRIARQSSHAATLQARVSINKTVVDAATAYWGLYGAIAEVTSQDKGMAEAQETWEKEKKRLELGESSKTQIAEAREQLERFRANRALTRKLVADAERGLRLVLGIPQEDGTRIVPTTIPETQRPETDWEQGYLTAYDLRPELRIQQASLNIARLQLEQANDLKRPDVNGYAGYSISGAGGQFDDALETIESNRYTSWWMGVSFERQLGRRKDKAQIRQSEIELARQITSMKAIEQSVLSDLHEAHQAVTNAWHVMQLQKDRQEAAATILAARRAMYDVGEISLEVYLRGISGASVSASEERSAIARYNQALIRWEYAQGTLMEFARISFDEFEPGNKNMPRTSMFIDDYLEPPKVRGDRKKLPGDRNADGDADAGEATRHSLDGGLSRRSSSAWNKLFQSEQFPAVIPTRQARVAVSNSKPAIPTYQLSVDFDQLFANDQSYPTPKRPAAKTLPAAPVANKAAPSSKSPPKQTVRPEQNRRRVKSVSQSRTLPKAKKINAWPSPFDAFDQ